MKIDWDSNESLLLANPAYSSQAKLNYSQILEKGTAWPGHIWLATSGSTVLKWVGVSKQAILASAHAVNIHLHSDASDKWALALPEFHAGGLGILARSYLSKASINDFKLENGGKWEAHLFFDYLQKTNSTLTALVPSQLYDLVQLKKQAPRSMRGVIIGGGQVFEELYIQAVSLGWKILPSYGMTECASQIATASLNDIGTDQGQKLKILPHIEVGIKDNRLAFRGNSLLSVYAFCEGNVITFEDPKVDGWFVSEDRGSIVEDELNILGRIDHLIKIGGESVDFARLESMLQTVRLQNCIEEEMTLLAVPHERLGYTINLVATGEKQMAVEQVKEFFDKIVLPFERIHQIHWVEEIPKSALSKILRKDLLKLIENNKV